MRIIMMNNITSYVRYIMHLSHAHYISTYLHCISCSLTSKCMLTESYIFPCEGTSPALASSLSMQLRMLYGKYVT